MKDYAKYEKKESIFVDSTVQSHAIGELYWCKVTKVDGEIIEGVIVDVEKNEDLRPKVGDKVRLHRSRVDEFFYEK